MAFHLKTMGDVLLTDPVGQPVSFPEKGLLILCLLITEPAGELSRRKLSRLLWQNQSPDTAYANLRKTISRILVRQKEIGEELIIVSDKTLRLNASNLDCDLSVIYAHRAEGPSFSDLGSMVRAFTGAFAESMDFPPGELATWRDVQRRKSIECLAEAISSLRNSSPGQGQDIIKDASARLFQHDPANAIGHLAGDPSNVDGERSAFRSLSKLTGGYKGPVGPQELRAARNVFDARGSQRPAETDLRQAQVAQSPLSRIALLPPMASPLGVGAMIAQSLVEDVTIALAASRQLQVVAPYTAAKIGLSKDKPALFEQHRISYVLDTRYSAVDDRPSLFVQLTHFANDEVIWAERISLEGEILAHRRGELASRVSATICDQVGRAEQTREYFEKSPTAYYHYLLGQRYLGRLTLPDLRRARKEFRTALGLYGDFSPALSGVARTLTKEWLLTARGDNDLLQAAEDSARKAITLGQDLPSGYRELGVARLLRGAIDESVEALSLAEAMSPHYADVIADFADTLVHASRPDRALEKIKLAMDLNPISPDSYLWTAAGAAYCLRQYDEALTFVDAMQDDELAIRLAAASWAMLGKPRKARLLVAKARETHPDFDLDRWLEIVPLREEWQREHYREGLRKAGF